MDELEDFIKILKRITILSINYGKIFMTKCLLYDSHRIKTSVRPLQYRAERFDNNKNHKKNHTVKMNSVSQQVNIIIYFNTPPRAAVCLEAP